MKKIYILICISFCSAEAAVACDYCNSYLGLNPHFKKNSIGLRYHYSFYRGTHEQDYVLQEMGLGKDDFWEIRSMYELHGQWYPVQKLQLLFSLPYIHNAEHSNPPTIAHVHAGHEHNAQETNMGIGDPVLIAHYQVFNKTVDDTSSNLSQRLFAGGGIKLPLGKWQMDNYSDPTERVHLPGSGAVGYFASIMYLAAYKKTGININASYLVTTTNEEYFRFGNTTNINVLVYYTSRINAFKFYPNTGLVFEHANKDRNMNYEIANSGGTILYGQLGADFYYRKVSLTFAAQLPVMQNLNENQPHVKLKLITGLFFAF